MSSAGALSTPSDLRQLRDPRQQGFHRRRNVSSDAQRHRVALSEVVDGHPYVGLVEDGLWMVAGFGGHGAMHGPPVAELLSRALRVLAP